MSAQESGDENDRRWQRWRSQMESIESDARELVIDDYVFRKSMHALESWPLWRRQNHVYGWLSATYLRDVILRIRRMLDSTKNTVSLRRLLEDIRSHPGTVTATRYAATYQRRMHDVGLREFAHQFAGPTSKFEKSSVEQHLADLEHAWSKSRIEEIAQRRLAHALPNLDAPESLIWQQLHDCVSVIERVTLRYRYLLLQVDNRTLLPGNVDMLDEWIRSFWLGEVPRELR